MAATESKTINILKQVNSSLEKVENIVENVKGEEGDTDKEIDSIDGFIDELKQSYSEKGLKNAVGQAEDVDAKLQDELQRLEKATGAHENQLDMIKNAESQIFQEESYTKQELDDAMQHIERLQQDLEEDELTQTISELEDALTRLDQVADELLTASNVFGKLIRQEQEEVQLEGHLEEEISEFHGEVEALHEFVQESVEGGSDEVAQHEGKVEKLLNRIEDEVQNEHAEISQELELGKEDLENLEKEINQFKQEFQEFNQEVEGLDANTPNSGQFKQYESRIQAIESNSQDVWNKAQKASQNIQKDESFFSKILGFFR